MGKIRTAETDYRYVLRYPDSGNKAILMGYHMSHSEKAQIHRTDNRTRVPRLLHEQAV